MVELRATSAIVKVTRSLEQLHAQITAHLLITNFFFTITQIGKWTLYPLL